MHVHTKQNLYGGTTGGHESMFGKAETQKGRMGYTHLAYNVAGWKCRGVGNANPPPYCRASILEEHALTIGHIGHQVLTNSFY